MGQLQAIERELAHGAAGGDSPFPAMLDIAARARAWGSGIYGVFEEMEATDGHLFSALQTRKNAVVRREWSIVAAGESARDGEVARCVDRVLRDTPALESVLFQLLDATGKGFAIAEVCWRADGLRGVSIDAIKPRPQGRFAFDASGALYLLGDRAAAGVAAGPGPRLVPRPGEFDVWARGARRMPDRKFLHLAFQPAFGSPYGSPLCARAYPFHYIKRATLRNWTACNEKYGTPTAVARSAGEISPADVTRLQEMLGNLRNETGIVLPGGVVLELLEAGRASGTTGFRELADWCNDEMSKIVLGQTLTSAEGRRSGSLALAEVHERVREEYVVADARALAAALNAQLVRWIVDFNFGTSIPAPRIAFDVADPADFAGQLKIDEQLIRMGVPLGTGYFYERYRRPAPREGERALRYDDANLYQYHLQFGVLTINEVRGALGLAPVTWGDVPPRPAVPVELRDDTTAGTPAGDETSRDEMRRDRRRR
jgi:phage gp29-like protein